MSNDATMRAYRLVEWERPPQVTDAAVPQPGAGEVVVKVAGNGLCHSDITMRHMPRSAGELLGWAMPFTLGHEIAGWVHALGAGVPTLVEGDTVALVSPSSCGRCWWCARGMDGTCPNGLVGRGYGADGGLAEYVLVRNTREVVKLASLDPVHAAPLTDAGATSYHAVRHVGAKLPPGSIAVVIGGGGLGSFAVQLLRVLTPAHVIAVDANPNRLDYLRELGAHDTLEGVDDGTAAALRSRTGGEGANAVLDFVGADSTIAAGIGSVRPAGAFALVGAGGGTLHAPWMGGLPREAEVFTFQGSNISDTHDVVALAEEGRIRSDVDHFSFEQIDDAYAAMEAGSLPRTRGRGAVSGPLEGVRVVDLTTVLSGPVAGAMLAEQGADVVKVEGPAWTDLTRHVSPHRNGFTEFYLLANRGKRSLVVDLRMPRGLEVFRRLVATADVVMQISGRASRRAWVSPTTISARRATTSCTSRSPASARPGRSPTSRCTTTSSRRSRAWPSTRVATPVSPASCATWRATRSRRSPPPKRSPPRCSPRANGHGGQHLSVSMLDATVAFLWTDAAQGSVLLGDDITEGNGRGANALWRHVDGWSTCAPVTDDEFRNLCLSLGCDDVADDPRFTKQADRLTSRDYRIAIRDVLQPAAAQLTVGEMLARACDPRGVPAVAAVPIPELHEHPQIVANGMLREVEHPPAGAMREPRAAAVFGGTPTTDWCPAPAFGEHTHEILAELGYDAATIDRLRDDGVVI